MSNDPTIVASRPLHHRPLAAAIAAVFALTAPAAYAVTYVTNCNDAGVGSLRGAVTVAVEGDLVDASGLTTASPGCSSSTITLTTGDIVATRNSLTIKGPGRTALNVTGKYKKPSRIFTHNGTGTLTIENMTVSKGYLVNATVGAKGGCIFSKSNVELHNVAVYRCHAKTTSGWAYGGGIYTNGNLTISASTVGYNTADGGSIGFSQGGGVWSGGNFDSEFSSIIGNIAKNKAHNTGTAGGVMAQGTRVLIFHSTISGNTAEALVGGMQTFSSTGVLTITSSTISGNHANLRIGGINSNQQTVNVQNSTIAFNTAGVGSATAAAGWKLTGSGAVPTATFQSTLIANNSYGSPAVASDISGNIAITGSNNLFRAPNISVPVDTIIGQCPLLAPLRDNGGPNLTHALLSNSPAIDSGYSAMYTFYDQRGPPNSRISGSAPDIGAYEVSQADKVFDTDFEGCS